MLYIFVLNWSFFNIIVTEYENFLLTAFCGTTNSTILHYSKSLLSTRCNPKLIACTHQSKLFLLIFNLFIFRHWSHHFMQHTSSLSYIFNHFYFLSIDFSLFIYDFILLYPFLLIWSLNSFSYSSSWPFTSVPCLHSWFT